jgi:hypothetical protein
MANAAQLLQASVESRGDRPAVKLDDTVLNDAILDAGVQRAAGMLRDGASEPAVRAACRLRAERRPTARTRARPGRSLAVSEARHRAGILADAG